MTVLTPCIRLMGDWLTSVVSERDGQPRSAGRSRTKLQTKTANTKVIIPTTTNDMRQPIQELIKAKGVVALSDPMPPIANRIPVMKANSRGRNHSESTFMVGTKSMATPKPVKVRPRMAQAAFGAKPSMTLPKKATQKKSVMALRGPQESDRRPAGNCMRA